jgi:uncharacterized protein
MEKELKDLMNESVETRSVDVDHAEIRADQSSRMVEGYAIVFNSESRDLGGFTEEILPSAVEGVLEKSDIIVWLDHNKNKGALARSTNGKGSLKYSVDSKGVRYNFAAPAFDLGNELLEGIRRGDIKSSSFAFTVSKGQKWEKRSDGSYKRTITKFDTILDFSPTYREAYQETTVALRNLDSFKISDIETPEVKAGLAETGTENLIGKVKKSDQERYQRQLNYSLKQKNK